MRSETDDRLRARQREEGEGRLEQIADVIRHAENRAMATDGPVSKTSDVITEDELRRIYELATATLQREGEREPDWKAMLERYGGHHSDCYWLADGDPSQGCNCGWQQRVHEHGLDVRLGIPPLEGVHAAAYEREDGRWSASVHLNGGYGMAVRSSLGLAMREALNEAIEVRAADPPADTEEGADASA